jgi:hypothetical protein
MAYPPPTPIRKDVSISAFTVSGVDGTRTLNESYRVTDSTTLRTILDAHCRIYSINSKSAYLMKHNWRLPLDVALEELQVSYSPS